MRKLGDTISRLGRMRAAAAGAGMAMGGGDGVLTPLTDFGSNPGALRGLAFVPDNLPANAPLVVVLHGCTQSAAGYDRGSGWADLARAQGFALLYPEQQRGNNANLCFNWFEPGDIKRGGGEALSIRQMVAAMIAAHGLDPARVFVTGLSAGGAMANVMLATYPEVFAGGAIIAGLPFGTARSVPDAFDRMRGHGAADGVTLAQRVLAASRHSGRWPRVQVWQGSADRTVDAVNAGQIVEQWRLVQGLTAAADGTTVDGASRQQWRGSDGEVRIEAWTIPGLGHGTPIDPGAGDGGGAAMPFMLPAGIASTRHITAFFGLLAEGALAHEARPRVTEGAKAPPPRIESSIEKTIRDALGAAGLLG